MSQAVADIREMLAGRPGGVNRLLRRFGKPVVDYCTALLPDRTGAFERLIEDIFVDVLAQARTAARARSDDEVFEFVFECAVATVRARYRQLLDQAAEPTRATGSYTFDEVVQRTGMSRDELTRGISEGRIRAVRADNTMKIPAGGMPGLTDRKYYSVYRVSAAERELLCLHFRLGFSPATIARWAGESTAHVESLIDLAASKLAGEIEKKAAAKPAGEDTKIRRYVDGRLGDNETAKFEREIVKDKIAQERLDALRGQAQGIRELLDSAPHDLSAISVSVRSRNPHHALALPPTAALWIQLVGVAAMLLMFHSVGAYIAPPDIRATPVVGTLELPHDNRLRVGTTLEVPAGTQALLTLDGSNRVLAASGTKIEIRPPRETARQVLRLHGGEVWGRFAAGGYPFTILGDGNPGFEVSGTTGAEFSLASGSVVSDILPENLEAEMLRALAARLEPVEGGYRVRETLHRFGWFVFEATGDDEGGLRVGDVITGSGTTGRFAEGLNALAIGDARTLEVARDDRRLTMRVQRREWEPSAVLRVFNGSVVLSAGRASQAVARGQWALLGDGAPLIGRRGHEDFRALRLSVDQRFKQHIHWLNTESYPLRAENSLLSIEREFQRMAAELEARREAEVYRNGAREIAHFEALMRGVFEAAHRRVAEGNPRPASGDAALGDEDLIAVEDEIMGAIAHWRRQSVTGVYTTLGDAAKTMHSPVQRDRRELTERDNEIARSVELQFQITELDEGIGRHDAAIAELRASELYDGDGSVRAQLDLLIESLDLRVRAGIQAASRRDMLRVRLNELDAAIDREQRQVNTQQARVSELEVAVNRIDASLSANAYTPEALEAAQIALVAAAATVSTREEQLAQAQHAQEQAEAAIPPARQAVTAARAGVEPRVAAHSAAEDALTEAVTQRVTRNRAAEDAAAEVQRLTELLQELPEDAEERDDIEAQLQQAQTAQSEANAALERAIAAADAANAALREAETALNTARESLAAAEADLAAKVQASSEADAQVTQARQQRDAAVTAQQAARDALERLQAAKVEHDELTAEREQQSTELEAARSTLKAAEERKAKHEADAAPRREQFARETENVHDGETARRELEEAQRQRGRHQAIDDDIRRRNTARETLVTERDRLAGSRLVAGYTELLEEFRLLERRIMALEFLWARALLEDRAFEHEQQAARDRFREAAERTEQRAIKLLEPVCPPYSPDLYARRFADNPALRQAVLKALWTLYYDSDLDRSDDATSICYYVVMQSGAGPDALNLLDSRWRTYLAEAVGREQFETLSRWTESDLAPAKTTPPEKTAEKNAGENAGENK